MVQKLDESVGSVIKALFEKQMLGNSIIIFTTDNGGPAAGFNGNAASNWPLRGVKNTLWEGGVRGAGLIWSPFIDPTAIGVSNQLIHIQDWLPTILRAVGVANPYEMTGSIDGIDMWDTIRLGLKSPRSEVLHNIDDVYGNEAVRVGPWKLLHGSWDGWYGPSGRKGSKKPAKSPPPPPSPEKVFRLASQSTAGKALRSLKLFPTNPAKVTEILQQSQVACNETAAKNPKKQTACNLVSGEYCLFNIEEDPCEVNNLAKSMPDIIQQLKDKLSSYRESAVLPINKPKDPRGLPVHWNYTWTNWMDFVGQNETKTNNLCN